MRNQAIYAALALTHAGEKEVLGLWIGQAEGIEFWLGVFTERKNRGAHDCCMACVDGLKGLPEAIETVFPQTRVQGCIVHQVRNSLKFVPRKERKTVAKDLGPSAPLPAWRLPRPPWTRSPRAGRPSSRPSAAAGAPAGTA